MPAIIKKNQKSKKSKVKSGFLFSLIFYTLLLSSFLSLITIEVKALNGENVDYIFYNANILTPENSTFIRSTQILFYHIISLQFLLFSISKVLY